MNSMFEGANGTVNNTADVKPIYGLDDIVGITSNTILTIPVIEDTYVENGASADINFGTADKMLFKGIVSDNTSDLKEEALTHRVPLLKFDISSLDRNDIRSVILTVECVSHQTAGIVTKINVYGCDPLAWSENEVTYNTKPNVGKYVASSATTSRGLVYLNVTDYVLDCLKKGDKEVSFILDGAGEPDSLKNLTLRTRENNVGVPAYLGVTCGEYGFSTDFAYEGENPWKLAMQTVSEWLVKWEKIKKGGDPGAEPLIQRATEYTAIVDAAQYPATNGADTRYVKEPTRLLSTLDNYTPDFSEGAKLDIYGGLMEESLKQEATGFFYTKKIGDRYWTIDPLGYPFYRTAVVTVTTKCSSSQTEALISKYGTLANWAQATTDRLRELGFNSAGNWSDTDSLIKVRAPLSQCGRWNIIANYMVQKRYEPVRYVPEAAYNENILPVFDPEFVTSAMKSVEDATKGYADSPEVYGWFSDNEQPANPRTLDFSLKKDPKNPKWIYAYTTAWTFMYMKTGNVHVTRGDVTEELCQEYLAMLYDRYFSVATLCRDKYVPNHQYIGCRFANDGARNEYVLRVAGQYCDVISYNYYGNWSAKPSVVENIQKLAGKPFLVSEWYAKGMDVWEKDNRFTNKSGAGFSVRNQEDRGKFYQNFTLSLIEYKGCVGFDWFEYMDSDPSVIRGDISNKGMLNIKGEEYSELTASMKEVNTQKYNLVRFFDERNHK